MGEEGWQMIARGKRTRWRRPMWCQKEDFEVGESIELSLIFRVLLNSRKGKKQKNADVRDNMWLGNDCKGVSVVQSLCLVELQDTRRA
jgi:hypothetical protein